MDSFSSVSGWVHYLSTNKSGFHMNPDDASYYDLSEGLLTMIAGIALISKFETFARRLAVSHKSSREDAAVD